MNNSDGQAPCVRMSIFLRAKGRAMHRFPRYFGILFGRSMRAVSLKLHASLCCTVVLLAYIPRVRVNMFDSSEIYF